jgi:hypothetical protein
MEEIEEKARMERDKDNIWQADAKRDLYDPDNEEKRKDRHQAILK